MLEVSHLTKKFGKVTANSDISFFLPDRSITILLGPNGAGKSTAIKSIIGFLKYEGSILVNHIPNKSLEAKRLIGYVPEFPALYPNLTVAEHLEFIARAYKLKDYKEYAEELLTRFELIDKKAKFGDELSKGMQQKLSICCALLPRPQVLLFDEPMVGLDPHAIKELKLLFEELKAKGASLLISTHMIDSVDTLWDETLIMKAGQVIAHVRKDELKQTGQTLEDIFFEKTEKELS
ncbi:MAG: ABC transporter ATP-binding protein [Lachnospiraceae bacterium]|nr:ABC transporter ATP-binding protein [Lachnospiraceae bacterium]